jgi:hypothetical protein
MKLNTKFSQPQKTNILGDSIIDHFHLLVNAKEEHLEPCIVTGHGLQIQANQIEKNP